MQHESVCVQLLRRQWQHACRFDGVEFHTIVVTGPEAIRLAGDLSLIQRGPDGKSMTSQEIVTQMRAGKCRLCGLPVQVSD